MTKKDYFRESEAQARQLVAGLQNLGLNANYHESQCQEGHGFIIHSW